MATTNINEDEWLKFMEFIRRKYGNNSSDFIRINDYNIRASKSVAEYYKQKYSITSINPTDNLEQLLGNQSFIGLFNLNYPVAIPKFTEIYNETDTLMRKFRSTTDQDDLYIKCNPTDDTEGNGFPNESTTNTTNTTNTSGSDLTSINPVISSDEIYNNVGFQVLISAFIIAVVIIIGLTFGNLRTYAFRNLNSSNTLARQALVDVVNFYKTPPIPKSVLSTVSAVLRRQQPKKPANIMN